MIKSNPMKFNLSNFRYAPILFIIFIFLFFRVGELAVLPHWFWDEGVNTDLSCNLGEGQSRSFAMKYSFLPHPPLYFLISALWLKVLGIGCSLTALRWLSVLLGLFSAIFLYLIVRKIGSESSALLAAALYSIFPLSIYWQRLAFANHLLALLILLSLYSWIKFSTSSKTAWLMLSCLSAGLCAVTQVTGLAVIVSVVYLLWRHQRPYFFIGAITSVIPVLFFVTYMVALMPEAFIHDFFYMVLRGPSTSAIQAVSVVVLAIAFYIFQGQILTVLKFNIQQLFFFSKRYRKPEDRGYLLKRDAIVFLSILFVLGSFLSFYTPTDESLLYGIDFYWIGLLGLPLIIRKKEIIHSFFLPFFILFLRIGRTDHMVIPLYPFFALGLTIMLFFLWNFWMSQIEKNAPYYRRFLRLFLALILTSFIWASLSHDINLFGFGQGLEKTDQTDYLEVADFLNPHLKEGDVVVAQSHFSRFIEADTCILTQSLAKDGIAIAYYPGDLGDERFAFDCSFSRARFFVLANDSLVWLENKSHPELKAKILEMPIAFQGLRFDVYENLGQPPGGLK
ncbi:MAG: glycosyltransferase family 39 protein [Candidatus Altiarchaeota archaeon]